MPEHQFPRQEYKAVRIFEQVKGNDFRSGLFYVENGDGQLRPIEQVINHIAAGGWLFHSLTPIVPLTGRENGYIAVFQAR